VKEILNFNLPELMISIIQANQKIARNYIKNYSGYHHDVRDIMLTYSNLFSKFIVNPSEYYKIYNINLDFLQAQQDIWRSLFVDSYPSINVIEIEKGDKRFLDHEWNNNPFYNFSKQNYLLVSKLFRQIIDEVEVDDKTKKKLDFYTKQYIDALSPSNFLFTNPEALRLAIETKGQSVLVALTIL
jgi:polyhydroxyalkanoate synthase